MYEIFEKLLLERGITAYKVAKETGVTTATLTSWKQGKYVPKAEKLQKIADYLNVSVEYLKTGKENSQSNGEEISTLGKTEKELLVLCRSLENVSEEEKEELVNTLKNTVNLFLKAKGLK